MTTRLEEEKSKKKKKKRHEIITTLFLGGGGGDHVFVVIPVIFKIGEAEMACIYICNYLSTPHESTVG